MNFQWKAAGVGKKYPFKKNLAIQFHLKLAAGAPGDIHAARVLYYDYQNANDRDGTSPIPKNGIGSKRSINRDFPKYLVGFPNLMHSKYESLKVASS